MLLKLTAKDGQTYIVNMAAVRYVKPANAKSLAGSTIVFDHDARIDVVETVAEIAEQVSSIG